MLIGEADEETFVAATSVTDTNPLVEVDSLIVSGEVVVVLVVTDALNFVVVVVSFIVLVLEFVPDCLASVGVEFPASSTMALLGDADFGISIIEASVAISVGISSVW